MTRTIALDWNEDEVRFVLAEVGKGSLQVIAAEAVPLEPRGDDEAEPAAGPGAQLKKALSARRAGRAAALIGLRRADVEVLGLTLPPARDEELPELVANQAFREIQTLGDDAVLDFVPLDDRADAPRRVTAVAASAEKLEQLKQTVVAAGLKPKRALLRTHALAALLPAEDATGESFLLAAPAGRELELAVVRGGRTTFARAVRLPRFADDRQRDDRLAAEIGRTLAVASEEGADSAAIGRVIVFGRPDAYGALADEVFRRASVPSTVVDPLAEVETPAEFACDDVGKFAPLLGMLAAESRDVRHPIDLLRPRRRPRAPSRRRPMIAGAAACGVALLVAAFLVWSTLSEVDAKNRRLSKRLSELKNLTKKAAKQQQVINSIASWEGRDVNWLDELRDLSLRFPSGRDALILRMTMTASRGGGGAIDLQGLVRDPEVVVRMERDIRDPFHEVRSKRVQERVQEKAYSWLFETSMFVARRDKSQYTSHLVPADRPAEGDRRLFNSKGLKKEPVPGLEKP